MIGYRLVAESVFIQEAEMSEKEKAAYKKARKSLAGAAGKGAGLGALTGGAYGAGAGSVVGGAALAALGGAGKLGEKVASDQKLMAKISEKNPELAKQLAAAADKTKGANVTVGQMAGVGAAGGGLVGSVPGAALGAGAGALGGLGAGLIRNAGAKSGAKGKDTKFAKLKSAAVGALGGAALDALLHKGKVSPGMATAGGLGGALVGHFYRKGQKAGLAARKEIEDAEKKKK